MKTRCCAGPRLRAALHRRPLGRGSPVARFHLGNGALIHAIHANADITDNGRRQSSGAMVNYLYDLDSIEKNHESFGRGGKIAASRALGAMSAASTQGQKATTP